MTRSRWRNFGIAGLFLSVSAFSKLHSKNDVKSFTQFNQLHNTVTQGLFNFTNYKILNFCLLAIFIFANLVKWTVFGKLSQGEVKHLRDKINYTIWEFCFGFAIFLREMKSNSSYKEGLTNEIVKTEFFKYSGLFLCILLLKSFHFLSAERAYSLSMRINRKVSDLHDHKLLNNQYKRLCFGVLTVNTIDVLLMYSFFHQMYYATLKFENNILLAIFGFEIFHMYPLIFFTGVKFALNYYEKTYYIDKKVEKEEYIRWENFKSKFLNLVEFAVNFIRFGMTCMFAIIFLYYFTFPFHILPSSYLSLRLLIIKARCLISFEKRNLKLKKLNLPATVDSSARCIICYENLSISSVDGIRCLDSCEHNFHYTCLKSWMNYSDNCPICRAKI